MKNMLWSWQKTRWFHFSIVVLWTTNCSRLENESMYILSLKMQNEHLMAADVMARYEIRWRFQKFRFNRAILHYWPRCLIGWVLWTDTGVRYFTRWRYFYLPRIIYTAKSSRISTFKMNIHLLIWYLYL